MLSKGREVTEVLGALLRDPSDFRASMKMVDLRSQLPPVRWAFERIVEDMPVAQRERLRELTLQPVDFDALGKLPAGTFGAMYLDFFRHQVTTSTSYFDAWPGLLETIQSNWVLRRVVKTHDMQHTLLGFETDVHSEVGLMAFAARNYRDPNGIFAMLGVPAYTFLYRSPRRLLGAVRRGWTLGAAAENVFAQPVEEMFELPIEEARARCGIHLSREDAERFARGQNLREVEAFRFGSETHARRPRETTR